MSRNRRNVSDIMHNPNPGQRAAFNLDAPWGADTPTGVIISDGGKQKVVNICDDTNLWRTAEVNRGRDYFDARAARFGMI